MEPVSQGSGSKEGKGMEGAGVPRHMLGSWGQADTPHPPPVTRVVGGSSPELLECKHLPNRALIGPLPAELVSPGWGRAGSAALQQALMAPSPSCLLQRL